MQGNQWYYFCTTVNDYATITAHIPWSWRTPVLQILAFPALTYPLQKYAGDSILLNQGWEPMLYSMHMTLLDW